MLLCVREMRVIVKVRCQGRADNSYNEAWTTAQAGKVEKKAPAKIGQQDAREAQQADRDGIGPSAHAPSTYDCSKHSPSF